MTLQKRDNTIYLIAFVAVICSVLVLASVIDVVIIGLTLAMVVIPVHIKLQEKIGKYPSVTLITTGIFILAVSGLIIIGTIIFGERLFIEKGLTELVQWIQTPAVNTVTNILPVSPDQMNGIVSNIYNGLLGNLVREFSVIPSLFIKLVIFLITFTLTLTEGLKVWDSILHSLTEREGYYAKTIGTVISDTSYAVYVVHITIAIITGIIAFPFFWFLGYGHVVFFASLSGALKLIPVIGPSFLMLIIAIFAFMHGDYTTVLIIVVIGYPVICAMPDLVIRPFLTGRRTRIHPALMWIGFFGGIMTLGISGFIIGPIAIALLNALYTAIVHEKTHETYSN